MEGVGAEHQRGLGTCPRVKPRLASDINSGPCVRDSDYLLLLSHPHSHPRFQTPHFLQMGKGRSTHFLIFIHRTLFFFFFFFLLFIITPMAYGGSQARGQIGAVAAIPHHSHSNARSDPHLPPTPQLTATLDP